MKTFVATLLAFTAVNADAADDAAEQSWYDSMATTVTDDLVTTACLCYDYLSTWDLRPMSFPDKSGYYFAQDFSGDQITFNPCEFLAFDHDFEAFEATNSDIPSSHDMADIIGDIDHATFAAYFSYADDDWFALTQDSQWKADTTTTIYATEDEDSIGGLSVTYTSDKECADDSQDYITFTFNVHCIEPEEDQEDILEFKEATLSEWDLATCSKTMEF